MGGEKTTNDIMFMTSSIVDDKQMVDIGAEHRLDRLIRDRA